MRGWVDSQHADIISGKLLVCNCQAKLQVKDWLSSRHWLAPLSYHLHHLNSKLDHIFINRRTGRETNKSVIGMLAGAYIRHYEREPADCQQDTNMPIIICVIIKQSLALWRLLSYPVWNMMRMPVELEELDNTIYFLNFASEIIPFSSHL